MRDCLKEKYSRDVLLSRNVFNTLLKVLEMQIDKNCVSFDLINCLITLIQYDSSSMESFWKHTKIIYRLLRVLPKCDEKTRLETSKLFVYVSFYDGKSQGEVIVVPNCVFDSFFLYGVGKSSSDLQKFPGKLADCIWETFAVSQSSEFHSKMLLDNLDEFRKSSNHTDFLNSLSYLARLCGHLSFGFFFLRNGIAESLSKFLLNTPASAEDCQVLLAVLSFILALPSNHDSIAELLLISWPNLLSLSISVDNSILTGAFRVELLESLSCWITKCDDNTILRILEKRQLAPRLVETLKRTDHHLELITIFVRLTDMNDFIDYVDESCWHELVSLMIQNIFYTFQTPFGKKHHSNESYLACIILKNISRLVIGRGVSPEWDSCWQIDNSMNWLSLILNHEKDDFQVCAIALLGNLIMCNNTFIELCNSIPYFIDSCITIITSEFEILEKKKESVILLSNFFISLKMRSGIEISGLDSADDWKKNGFQTIGQIFGVLPELLEFNYQPLTEATSLLIFNLCCANKHLMRKSLKDYFVFTRLFENPQSDTNENTCLEYFCNFENKKIHKYSINATFGNIVRICSILIEGDANYCTYLIQQTNFLPYLKYVLDNLNLKERDIAPDCCILFALILQTHTPENFEFEKLPLNTETAFSLIADCVKYDEESARLSGYSFFSQYFWWTISLNRSDTLSTAQSALNSIVHILIENLFSFGSHKESNAIENCLQQILFNFVFAKEIALKGKTKVKQ